MSLHKLKLEHWNKLWVKPSLPQGLKKRSTCLYISVLYIGLPPSRLTYHCVWVVWTLFQAEDYYRHLGESHRF